MICDPIFDSSGSILRRLLVHIFIGVFLFRISKVGNTFDDSATMNLIEVLALTQLKKRAGLHVKTDHVSTLRGVSTA